MTTESNFGFGISSALPSFEDHFLTTLTSHYASRLIRTSIIVKGGLQELIVLHCGACKVIMDGKAVNGCLLLALQVEYKEIETIEGLRTVDDLYPLQKSLIKQGRLNAGFAPLAC